MQLIATFWWAELDVLAGWNEIEIQYKEQLSDCQFLLLYCNNEL